MSQSPRPERRRRVAVLGAGLQGACAALELARRGAAVDLYDRNGRPMAGASLANEGKIHLGLVYANDGTLRTARRLLAGAVRFTRLLDLWTAGGFARVRRSTPFRYVVHRRSLLEPGAIRHHFEGVERLYREAVAEHRGDYLGERLGRLFTAVAPPDLAEHHDDAVVAAAFDTAERSVDTDDLADLVRGALAASPRIDFHARHRVSAVSLLGARPRIDVEHAGARVSRSYDHVVNALWDGRLAIDASAGLAPGRPWLYRFKHRIVLARSAALRSTPSTTVVLGPFGDIVRFGDGKTYLSWYPACMTASGRALAPPAAWIGPPGDEQRAAIVRDSLRGLATICPAVAELGVEAEGSAVQGGTIVAWGSTDIDDPGSELHGRFDVGVRSVGAYHTIDTGKLGLAPGFAVEVAERILGAAARQAWAAPRPAPPATEQSAGHG